MQPFVDELVAYLEGPCGQHGFREQMKGVREQTLVEFERSHFGGRIPSEYREFLLRMGASPASFTLIDDDMGGFEEVMEWYKEEDDPAYPLPRGESILIAIGMAAELFLDGAQPGSRPVWYRSQAPARFKVADSFKSCCMQRACELYRLDTLGWKISRTFVGGPSGPVDLAIAEATKAGLALEPCSDSVTRILLGKDVGLTIFSAEGRWKLLLRCPDEKRGEELAEAIAKASGTPLPRTPAE